MLSKAKIQLIRSLEQKKHRDQLHLFIAEGDKIVREMLASPLSVEYLLAQTAWLELLPDVLRTKAREIIPINDRELQQISFLKTPHQALALVQMPQYPLCIPQLAGKLSLYLDCVQDPSNLGAIIRIADWFGIRNVLCSSGCADPFNPKAIQSSMGAIIRVKTYAAGQTFFHNLRTYRSDFHVYGAFLNGENIYQTPLPQEAIIVMGNESKGIGSAVAQYVTQRVLIPPYPAGETASESLNVSMATAIICAEFRRRACC